jgi:NCAIR mutase (PurE)-related protein
MNEKELRDMLEGIRDGHITIDAGIEYMKDIPFKDLGFAMLDSHRELRIGYPETVYCAGKTVEQVTQIIRHMLDHQTNILATRATREMYEAVRSICDAAHYNALARAITIIRDENPKTDTGIAIIAAGTSDLPVVEEAAVTADILGNRVDKIVDVGVAGIHRLFDKLDVIRKARVVIVVAGMEGALPSVVGGLVNKPIIAVPTSVGYGASFGGITALLAMLNSCASGVCVVNIDNGYGAACVASLINHIE